MIERFLQETHTFIIKARSIPIAVKVGWGLFRTKTPSDISVDVAMHRRQLMSAFENVNLVIRAHRSGLIHKR